MNNIDIVQPKIKLGQEAINQKSISESVSYYSEIVQEQSPLENKSPKYKQNQSQASKIGWKSIYQYSKGKKKVIKRFQFNESFLKNIAQKLINKSNIIQSFFQNHQLLSEEYLNDNSFKFKNINKIQKIVPIISFNNRTIQIWEVLKEIIYLYFMWMMPFSVFLPNQDIQISHIILYYIIIIDNILQLNQEIIVKGQLISDRRLILQKYIKNKIIFELFYLFCFTCITYKLLQEQITQIINILFFFFNLKKFQKFIQNYQERAITINEKINLIELIITVLMLAHFMACIWFYVGIISQEYYSESWILKLNLQNENILTQYCYSFYWAATTMVTVGYGDITGQNLYEIICSTVLLFFSSGIFAFSMNSIGMILNNINQNGQQYRRNLLLINQYMTQNEVSSDLQVKVRNYLQFYFQSQMSNHQKDVNTIIDQLSQNLKVELISDVRQKTIQNNSFLSKYFSNYTKLQITQKSESINYTPLEQIYMQKSNEDHSLYVISKGFINLIDQNSGRIIQQLKQGDSFGELEFLTEQPRYLSAYSKGFSQILKINRNDFIQIIRQKQKDFEQFHMLKDQILFKIKSPYKCIVCNEHHILFECNKIFYKPDIEKLIKQDLFYTYQDRTIISRGKQKNLFRLSDNYLIKDACISYRYQNEIETKSQNTIANADSDKSESDQEIKQLSKSKSLRKSILQQKQNTKQSSQQFLPEELQNLTKLNQHRISQLKPKQIEDVIPKQLQQMKTKKFQSLLIQNQQSNADSQTKQNGDFIQLNLDALYGYQVYFPNNSIKNVLKLLEKFNKVNVSERQVTIPSEYRFFQIKKSTHRLI